MLIQDAQFFGIQPLIAFCKAQLGEAPPAMMEALRVFLEDRQVSARPLSGKLLETVEEALESKDKALVEEALLILKAWDTVPWYRNLIRLALSGAEYLDRRYPEYHIREMAAEVDRLLADPEIEEQIFQTALDGLKRPAASPIWALLTTVLTRMVMVYLGFRERPAPVPQQVPPPIVMQMFPQPQPPQ